MKTPIYSLALSLGLWAGMAAAQQTVTIDGADVSISTLMEQCQSMTGDPRAQIDCFTKLAPLMDAQNPQGSEPGGSDAVTRALADLRSVAQYLTEETGLVITGDSCNLQVLYFGNFFHISRRNISTIDLIAAQFDAAQFDLAQSQLQGSRAPFSRAQMQIGAEGQIRGGVALESAQMGFAPRSAQASLDVYAVEVAAQLSAQTGQLFEFILVHPQRTQDGQAIWNAFENVITACQR